MPTESEAIQATLDEFSDALWLEEGLAKNTLDGKRRRISISVNERDLMKIKTKAAEEGMPYQTLIGSILHKAVSGGA